MSIQNYISSLSQDQLLTAKQEIEQRLNQYKEAKKIKFASIVYGGIRSCWIDTRDEVGWTRLESEYVKSAAERFPMAKRWVDGEYKNSYFNDELPKIDFVVVSELEYDEWLKDSLNPSFKANQEGE